jgi:hypothetical protein
LLLDSLIEGVVPVKLLNLGSLSIVIREGVELDGLRVGIDELLHNLHASRATSLS